MNHLQKTDLDSTRIQEQKPLILLPWNDVAPRPSAFKIINMIEENGADIFKLIFTDTEINCPKIKAEVESIVQNLKYIPSSTNPKSTSIAYKILEVAEKGDYPEISKILIKVKVAVDKCQGLLLPGGQDIQPIFYGQLPKKETVLTDDFRRDLFEIATHREADLKKLPIFGICRGLQVGNICYGGSLHQHVDGHLNCVQKYSLAENSFNSLKKSVIKDLFEQTGNAFFGDSRHHQAVDQIGEGLTVIAKSEDGTVKALENLGGRFGILVQWHPETAKDENMISQVSVQNNTLFERFVLSAKEYSNRQF